MSYPWISAVARRLGLPQNPTYAISRNGFTFQIPCSHGHTVSVEVPRNKSPDAVAKDMIQSGWKLGSKTCCPQHANTPAPAVPVVEKAEDGKEFAHAFAKAITELEETKKEQTPMATAPIPTTPAPTKPAAAPAAPVPYVAVDKKTQRLIMQALEDYYCETEERYKAPHTDASVAEEVDAPVEAVSRIREEFFGPLTVKEDPAITAFRTELEEGKAQLATLIAKINEIVDKLDTDFLKLCEED